MYPTLNKILKKCQYPLLFSNVSTKIMFVFEGHPFAPSFKETFACYSFFARSYANGYPSPSSRLSQ